MDEAIKILLPWGLIAFWAVSLKSLKGQRLNTLFFTIFAGFSANFSTGYREIYQLFSIILAVYWLLYFLRTMKIDRWNVLFLAFYGVALLSILLNGLSDDAVGSLTNLTLMFFVTNYLIKSLHGEKSIKLIFDYLYKLSVLMAIFAIFEYLLGMRSELTFSNPNYFAAFLIPGLAWSLLSPYTKPRWIGFALITFAIFASGSRSALFAVPIVISLFYLKSLADKKQSNFIRLFVFGMILAAVSVSVGGERILNAGRDDGATEASDGERVVVFEVGYAMLHEHPVLGVGWGKFAENFGAYAVKSVSFMPNSPVNLKGVRDYVVTHNDFMRVITELGLIGFSVFIVILVKSHSAILDARSGIRYPLLAMFYGILFFSVAHNNMNSALFWFLIMLPFALKRLLDSDNSRIQVDGNA